MKKVKTGIFFIAAIMSFNAVRSQTADQIIDKYITAMGGKEKMMSLTSVKMEGSLHIQGMEVGMTLTRKHMVGTRIDMSVGGTENYQIVTPEKGWVFMPVQGQTAPEEMGEDQFKSGQNLLDMQGALLNYKEKGTIVEFGGTEKVDSNDCYKLKVTFKNGIHTDYFIDSKTYHISKASSKGMVNGEEMEIATTFFNYKQNADGYWFPYSNSTIRGETHYDKIETNIKVDESIFIAK